MRVGTLNKLITIEQPQDQRDAVGGFTAGWSEFAKAWAGINPLSGNEKYVSAERHATATHQITMRYIAGVTSKMRMTYDGRVFEIASPPINIGERNKMLQIIAEEKI